MVKRILVALSGTPFTESAVRHAVELAGTHGAELTGVTDVDLAKVANVGPVPMGGGAAAHDLVEHRLQQTEEHAEQAIATFEDACGKAGLEPSVVRETGSPFEKLISLWRYHDLTVAGLRGLFEYGVVHEPDDLLLQLVSKGVRPILAVAREYRPIKRVLVAYNGSMESAKALKQFCQTALWPDPTIKIVCFGRDQEEAEQLLADAAHYCGLYGHSVEGERMDGSAKDKLLPHADQWKADLIVMGSTSQARLFKHLLGDTTLHAVREAEIPLFLTQ